MFLPAKKVGTLAFIDLDTAKKIISKCKKVLKIS